MTREEVAEAYGRFGHLVLRRCLRILREDHAAEDVLQEVFVRLWRYGDSFKAAESKVFWLYRVTDRCCFDHLSRRGRRAETPLDKTKEIAGTPSPGQAVEDRDLVLQFLDRFDDRLKQVAIHHYVDEMTQEDIALATGWSRQTIVKKLAFLRERAARLHATLYGDEI